MSKEKQPMIEMNVAIGNFDSNPVVSSLLDDDHDGNPTEKCDVDRIRHNIDSDRGKSIIDSDCIDDDTKGSESDISGSHTSTEDSAPFLQVRSTKRRKTQIVGSK